MQRLLTSYIHTICVTTYVMTLWITTVIIHCIVTVKRLLLLCTCIHCVDLHNIKVKLHARHPRLRSGGFCWSMKQHRAFSCEDWGLHPLGLLATLAASLGFLGIVIENRWPKHDCCVCLYRTREIVRPVYTRSISKFLLIQEACLSCRVPYRMIGR